MPEILDALGYNETWSNQLALSLTQIPGNLMHQALIKQTREPGPSNLLGRVFCLSYWAPLQGVLPNSMLETLEKAGILRQRDGLHASTVDLAPVGGRYLISDRAWGPHLGPDSVYPPGLDSLAMCRWTPRWKVESALDLGTGSGIQAVITAAGAARVDAFDINPRALQLAAFSARLNGSPAIFQHSDLYSAAAGKKYDLILSNPPWVPAPEKIETYRGGGASGEIFSQRICQGLAEHLNPGGRAALYLEYPRFKGQHLFERVRSWLGPGSWGLALLHRRHYTALEYVAGHTTSHFRADLDFERWLESYESIGIEGVSASMLFILPSESDWQMERDGVFPLTDQSQAVEEWLETRQVEVGRFHRQTRLHWPEGPFADHPLN
ncbi:MAG: methyltransferase [Vulcanimicrobiota bacterium]